MAQKKVLEKIGVFALTVMLAAAPIMAVNASSSGSQMENSKSGTPDTGTPDPTAAPAPEATPAPVEAEDDQDESSEAADDNYVVVAESGVELVSTVPGVYTVNVVPGVAITTDRSELPNGMEVAVTNSTRGEAAAQSIKDGLAILEQSGVSAEKGPEIDISAYLSGLNQTDLDREIAITIGIPAEFRQAGCDYAVMLIQEGGRVSILPNTSQDPSMITVSTSGFGVYVIVKAPAGSFQNFQ